MAKKNIFENLPSSQVGPSTPVVTPTINEPVIDTQNPVQSQLPTNIDTQIEGIQQTVKNINDIAGRLSSNESDNLSGVVSSSEPVVQEEIKVTEEVTALAIPREVDTSGIKLLEEHIKGLESRRKSEISGIEQQFQQQFQQQAEAQAKEKGTTNVALTRLGGFLGGSGSGTGVLLNLAETHKQENALLRAKKNAAISSAQNAIDDKQFEAARLIASEIRSIDKEIDDRRNEFFDQNLKLTQEDQRQENATRDDARASLNAITTNFGGIDFESLDESTFAQLVNLSKLANIPLETLAGPTIKEESAEQTVVNNQIRNAISTANLQLSQARFNESLKITAVDAQRLGLPRQLVGRFEEDVVNQLQSGLPPAWYLDTLNQQPNPPQDQVALQGRWNSYRNEVLTTTSLFNFGSLGVSNAAAGIVTQDLTE